MKLVDISLINHEQEVIESVVKIPKLAYGKDGIVVRFVRSGIAYGRAFPNCPYKLAGTTDLSGDFMCGHGNADSRGVIHCGCASKRDCPIHMKNKDVWK
jgi:hypothetical protein